ncbi:glycosyltransferase family 2 protein [Sinomonas sp. ASV486]|uniref:glycosyltransferase family 2 protein n=1 Tax=Sinomonas sp. ASV486 TaxID=3051170 RepID=UPI0027DCDABF|nr:glycosyltransferase family 2 protein [Sinomonas sp. ASV486]MDQ4490982.1 glycosyltransferase family 2 protein [Sinomonas sp. ASV486]
MSVAAVVVSYNRKDLLRQCLASLEIQGEALDEIIVIENGSTDGSPDMVRKEFPSVTLSETGANLGGAGGFAWGIQTAIERGHTFGWLMDDDANPAPGSLAPLVEVALDRDLNAGFVAAQVTDEEGTAPNPGHPAVVDPDPQKQIRASAHGALAVTQATFVGLLVNLEQARTMPLPYADFFIWFDDAEYTRRLASRSIGVYVPGSVVRHPAKPANPDMAGRLFYYVRNHIWLSKLSEGQGVWEGNPAVKSLRVLAFALTIFAAARSKRTWASALTRGVWEGLTRSPRAVMPGEYRPVGTSVAPR